MKLVKTLFGVLFASALFTITAIGATNEVVTTTSANSDLWNVTIGGASTIPTSGGNSAVSGLDFSLARQTTLLFPSETGIRQNIGWVEKPNENVGSWVLNTTLFNDWNLFRVGSVQFLGGGNAGLTYGNTSPSWTVAPEAVVRLWIKKDVFAEVIGSYNFDVSNSGRFKSQDAVGLKLLLGFSF